MRMKALLQAIEDRTVPSPTFDYAALVKAPCVLCHLSLLLEGGIAIHVHPLTWKQVKEMYSITEALR